MQSIVHVSESRFWRVFATAFVLAWALRLTASAASPDIFIGSIKGVAINVAAVNQLRSMSALPPKPDMCGAKRDVG